MTKADPRSGNEGVLAFGEFELDEGALSLRRGGEPVEIAARPLQILAFLCRNHHRFVTKEELLDRIWGETAVSEASVFTALREIRRALDDDGREQRFIQTRRRHGYQFVADVAVREDAPPPALPGGGAFVGREALIRRLRRAWEECREGRGGIVLLAGEPGIGKTRCIEELTAHLPDVCRGSCMEGEAVPPYWPWIQILRALREGTGGAELAGLVEGSPAARLLSEAGAAPAATASTAEARFQLLDAVRSLLARAASEAPRVLVLEDLHWADPSSLQLLEFLSLEAGQRPWLLLGSYRDTEALPPHPLNETLGRLRRQPGVRIESVEGLDESAVGTLVERLGGEAPAAETIRDTRERTGGNPLWIRALYGLSRGSGDEALSRSRAPVREILEGLAGRLSPETRRLLECAAVLGADVSLARLGEVAELDQAAMRPLVAEAERAGFVVPGRTGRLRFVHALIQEVLYQSLPVEAAAALHGRAARVLVAFHGDDPGHHLSEIAGHFDRTAAWGGAAEALEYSRRAADHALHVQAFDEAAAHLARARTALAHLRGADEQLRCDLLLAEGEARALGGRLTESVAACRPAVDIARRLDDGERLARAAIGCVGRLLPMGILDPREVELLEEALREVPEAAHSLRAELLLRLAAHASAAGVPSAERELMAQAEAEAARSGDPAIEVLLLRTRAYNRAGGVDPLVRLEAAAEAFERAEAAGDHEAAALAIFLGITGRLVTGEVSEADREAQALARRVERQRLLQVEPFLQGYRATRAVMRGDFDVAERLALETVELGRRISSPVASLYFGGPQLGEIRRAQGRAAEVVPVFAVAPEQFPDQVGFLGPLVLMLAEAGELDEGRKLFRRARSMGFETLPIDANRLTLITAFAEAAELLGEREGAGTLYELARPHAERFAAAGHAQACLAPMTGTLGVLAGLAGWHGRADDHFAEALRGCDAVASPPLAARTRLHWARALAEREPRNGARIGELLGEALEAARPIGMRSIVARAERMLGEIGSGP